MKYKYVLQKWQKKEFGILSSIIPVLFYQGLDNWDPEKELEEERKLTNPILSEKRQDILIFDLRKIDPLNVFGSSEMKAGMLLLKIIHYPWDEFIEEWNKIKEILNSMEETKRIDLEEEMLDYIFRSRTEENSFLEEAIMGKKVLTAYERALEEGEFKNKIETARNMKNLGLSMEVIVKSVGLTEAELRENGIF
jgi:predicted transposase/invertase (TIGR01784 family)